METTLAKNEEVGKWRIEKQLGAGGQASVWRVRYIADNHSPLGALKICSSPTTKAKERFNREIQLLQSQNHPGIVRVREFGVHKSMPFFVMELATTTLEHVAAPESTGTRLILESREILLRLLRQSCEAIAHLHRSDILHRDIKPSNILLMLDPPEAIRAVVSDLGIAANEVDQGQLTATHETIGTPAFRAPESLTGRHTKQSDVYSLGKTIESVFNKGPSREVGPGRCLRDQRLTNDLWDALDAVLQCACAFNPSDRYEDASRLLEAMPDIILGLKHTNAPKIHDQRPTTISLNVAERITLFYIIAECPAVDETVILTYVRNQTQKRLTDYNFSVSVHRLVEIEFVEISRVEDQNGHLYTHARPTRLGVNWAQTHSEEMNNAVAESAPNTSDDIPF